MADDQDWEEWQRRIVESLRPIDAAALFWVGLSEIDLRGAPGHRLDEFPFAELVAFVDGWLAGVDPDGPEQQTAWQGGGVRLGFRARGRKPAERGWQAMPSLNLLEQPMADLHLLDGGRRQLHTFTVEELRRLAAGEVRVVGQGASYQETFAMIADMLDHFGLETVGELPPEQITVFAGALGLVEPPPSVGSFEQGWRQIHGVSPDE
jgi:hypothetical protein